MLRQITSSVFALVLILASGRAEAAALKKMTWKVGDVTRSVVYLPTDMSKNPPLIFGFHGHGGTSEYAARKFAFHELWPEAICVYPQGLPTKTIIDPDGKQPGWQKAVGDEGSRDVEFFDAMLKTMKNDYHVDEKRIFVSGHSNGGFFTYVLWATRGDELAAVAPISAFLDAHDVQSLKPKPVLHVAGEKDTTVKFVFQQHMMEAIRRVDGCDPEGKPAGKYCTKYTSESGPTVITFIHPGGHEIPDGGPRRIIEFFKAADQTLTPESSGLEK